MMRKIEITVKFKDGGVGENIFRISVFGDVLTTSRAVHYLYCQNYSCFTFSVR